jgi:hypothetical protein
MSDAFVSDAVFWSVFAVIAGWTLASMLFFPPYRLVRRFKVWRSSRRRGPRS